jgi:hypothetical protein
MTNPTGDRDFLDGLTTLSPPEDLRATTLAAARRAAIMEPAIPRWRALPAFFAAQPGWASALVALLVVHLTLGFFLEETRASKVASPRDEEVAAQPDLLRLPRIEGPARATADEGDRS